MPPSKLSILLGISLLLWLPPTPAAADEEIATADGEEIATADEVARLAASQHELQAKLDTRLHSQVDALIEDRVGRNLAADTTQLLRRQTGLVAFRDDRDDAPPAAMLAVTDAGPSNPVQQAPNTTCTIVGSTLECVLRDVDSR